jgi:hypothetical protein
MTGATGANGPTGATGERGADGTALLDFNNSVIHTYPTADLSMVFGDDDATNALIVLNGNGTDEGDIFAGDLRLGYNSSSPTITTADSGEALTIDPAGTGAINLIGDTNVTGAVDISGTIQAGSSNINLTLSTGMIDADAITLITSDGNGITSSGSGLETTANGLGLLQGCSDGQTLKWDESGAVWECGSDRATTQIRKSSNETVTSSAALQDDDELTFSIGANETWIVQVHFTYTTNSSATPDIRVGLNNSATGATCVYSATDIAHAGNLAAGSTACNTAIILATTATGTKGGVLTGTVTSGGGSGTVVFRWGQGTSDGTNGTTVVAGSSLLAYKVNGADLAEVYYSKESDLTPGTVLQYDSSILSGVKKSQNPYEQNVIGVVTTKPGLVMGDFTQPEGTIPVLVALTGRIPVKVSTENGPILPGDYLTSSSIPGVAMKATKLGPVIGQALESYAEPEIGTVNVFIKNGETSGSYASLLETHLPGINVVDALSERRAERSSILRAFIDEKEERAQYATQSAMVTDRIAAGIDIVTPEITAQTAFLDEIRAASSSGTLAISLGENGTLNINGKDGSVAVVNADGSVTFTGKVRIEDLSVGRLTIDGVDEVASLSAEMAYLRDLFSQSQSVILNSDSGSSESTSSGIFAFDSEAFESFDSGFATPSATETDSLAVRMSAIIQGTLDVLGEAIFRSPVSFLSSVIFKTAPIFPTDTAGIAVIPKYQTTVDIEFEKPYKTVPVISLQLTGETATMSAFLQEGKNAVVTNVTEHGFTIALPDPALTDYEYNWIAIAVDNKKKTVGRIIDDGSMIFPKTSKQPVPTPTSDFSSGSLPLPTPTLSPNPTATPSGTTISDFSPSSTASGGLSF